MSTLRPRRLSRQVRRRRRLVIAIATAAAVIVAGTVTVVALTGRPEVPMPVPSNTPSRSSTPPPVQTPTPTPTPTPTFNKSAQSIDDPSSYWVVVDKLRPLSPADYEAPDLVSVPVQFANEPVLRQAASDAVVAMFAAFAAETGLQMQSQSAYRSYSTQVSVYQGWVDSLGQAGADATSARPGYSEHQTGLALDVSALPANCTLDACFADTPQGQWLAANGWRFGFILRYPADKTAVTGYEFEPWHMRFVGIELATEMHNKAITTLEEFFGLPAAPDYG
ncbi:MAG: M15 family metallopeptidase [Rhodoglobus sp.]